MGGVRLACGFLALGLGLAPEVAWAWPAELMRSLERDACRLLPRSLANLVLSREEKIFGEEARLPVPMTQALAADMRAGRLTPATLALLEGHLAEIQVMFGERRVGEGIVRLGALLRIPADLADPVLSVGPEGYPPGLVGEYYGFVEDNLDKIPVVLSDEAALHLAPAEMGAYWQRLLTESRGHAEVVRTEMFRGGRVVGRQLLDYRSPVFGVASLSYSRAVTGIAATWLVVWRAAGGDLSRVRRPVELAPQPGVSSTENTRSTLPIGRP